MEVIITGAETIYSKKIRVSCIFYLKKEKEKTSLVLKQMGKKQTLILLKEKYVYGKLIVTAQCLLVLEISKH